MRFLLAPLLVLAIAAPASAIVVPARSLPATPATPAVPHVAPATPATPPSKDGGVSTDSTSVSNFSVLEQELLGAVNSARAANGLAPLVVDAALENAARAHTQNLLDHGAFTHDFIDPNGHVPFVAWIARYYHGPCAAENLATGTPSLSADEAVQMWLASPGHRANLLSPGTTTVGVELESENGTWIATADFGGC
jgi:uncharacterized protein YkwD